VRAAHLGSWAVLVAFGAAPLAAQTGFPTGSAEAAFEAQLIAVPDTASAELMTRVLSARPHLAGTAADRATRDYVMAQLHAWGLETWSKTYTVYMPRPLVVRAWVAPRSGAPPLELPLKEPPLLPRADSSAADVPAFSAYSGTGDTAGDVVYVNYGLMADYDTLAALGVSVRGRIVLARYGRSYRGIKAREAQARGAAGLILYSDPAEDGYVRGDVYPVGPMRPAEGVQRGSVLNDNGDPSSPTSPSLPGAHHLPEDSMPDLPRIVVIPIGYGNAQRILGLLDGPSAPTSWQGGLPFHYHVGPGPAHVRLRVVTERGAQALHDIWDTFGMVRGAVFPDQWVILGGHRDAWCPGAADNVSGAVTVLEVARAFAALARQGLHPARSVLFATWDAEEWALIGSTEWVEELEDSVRARTVAYINEDDVTNGPRFEGAASPSLKPLLRDATRGIPDPSGSGSIYDAWRAQTGDSSSLAIGDLGGGSDFSAFTDHLGVPSLTASFSGPSGVYHSMYDTYDWMARFGDPTWHEHRALSQVAAVITARLANATVLPLDYTALGEELIALVTAVDSGIVGRHWRVSTLELRLALGRLTASARAFATTRDSVLGLGLDPTRAARANGWILQVERRLTRPEGLAGRPWYRSLEFASDPDNGYSTLVFPSVNEAIRRGDLPATERELGELVTHVDLARDAVERASAALRGRAD